MKIGKAILITFMCVLIYSIVFLKVLGAYVETPVERQGYCKLSYDDGWKYNKEKQICYNPTEKIEPMKFSEKDFKEQCPKPKLISTQFWSECFKANNGEYIN